MEHRLMGGGVEEPPLEAWQGREREKGGSSEEGRKAGYIA